MVEKALLERDDQNGILLYYCDEYDVGSSSRALNDSYPFVLPLPPRLPGFWCKSKWWYRNTYTIRYPSEQFRLWAKEVIRGRMRLYINSDYDTLFYQFKTETDLIVFKMRWSDELY
jgi:hypothetical protein